MEGVVRRTVPLSKLVEEGVVVGARTPGQLVDAITDRGDAVVVDVSGRLAAPLPVARRLRREAKARERVAIQEAKKAEDDRLARLQEYEREREGARLQRLESEALRERIFRVEQASGLALWQLESEVTRARTQASGRIMTYDQKAIEEAAPVGLDEVEEFVLERYGLDPAKEGR